MINNIEITEVVGKLNDHDRHLDTLSNAVEGLTSAASTTNGKLDKLVDAISKQNVLAEKVANMDTNIADSFARRDARISALEDIQKNVGCSKVQLAKEGINSLGRSLDTVRDELKDYVHESNHRMESIEAKNSTFIGGGVVRWALGIMVTLLAANYAISNATNSNIHKKIDENAEKIHMQLQINKNNEVLFNNEKTKLMRVEKELDTHIEHYQSKKENLSSRLLKIEAKVNK